MFRENYIRIYFWKKLLCDFFDTINVRKYYLCPAFRNVVKDIKNNNSLFKDSILNITINGDTSTANYNNDYMIVEEFLEEFFSSSFWTDIVNIIKIKNKIIDAKEYFKNASSEDKTKLEDLVKYYSDLIIKILDYLENDKRIFKYFMEENNFKFLILE